jgi:hypothetical protein
MTEKPIHRAEHKRKVPSATSVLAAAFRSLARGSLHERVTFQVIRGKIVEKSIESIHSFRTLLAKLRAWSDADPIRLGLDLDLRLAGSSVIADSTSWCPGSNAYSSQQNGV